MTGTDGEPSSHRLSDSLGERPILASIGTVLIDAFDSPPRPVLDTVSPTIPSPPSILPSASGASQPSSPVLQSAQQLIPPSIPNRLVTPTASPAGSGPSTPQLSLDDVPMPNAEDVYEMLGGGALFALVGARFWLPPHKLKTLVDRAPEHEENDLPAEVEEKLDTLGKDIWVYNRGEGTRMTRARIRYEGDVRFFQPIVKAPFRTVPQLRASLLGRAEYLHISPPYSPENVNDLLVQLREHNNVNGNTLTDGDDNERWAPKIVFEPTPPSCHPGQREWLEKIIPDIYVLSPNHEELFSFYGIPKISFSDPELRPTVERLIHHVLHNIGIWKDGTGIVVVRCGRLGACIGTVEGGLKWCPAYFEGEQEHRVRDVTGAGNSFLGGFVAGLSVSDNPYEALLYATISASFVVEQFGLPTLTSDDGEERWNDDSPKRRLEDLRQRMSSTLTL
ncbi:pfkB family carbohydrate kinase superfamily protein [Kwoniella heveanensis CBS 569]|uniref:PfkB family carbohydrate kinase superfamily protein n=1 Tax=Kwoniella heveanensis BCC8398 TaxID=1296120 RepID=A0A1B9GY23_9TREE|nr:pfkB family carbohydrate kinase superfamily protein [Kwoniella heveanensis BCC8398]OCF45568.1 pfkB family carbohydrate kinase superfamily protein [Kwoniella heveanensis CBS 569]